MTSAASTPPESPGVPDRFEILEELPSPGSARLLRAHDTLLLREVFLKCPAPVPHDAGDGDALRDRCLREARALATIENPAVDRLLDVLETPEGPLLVLEPVRGETLATRLAREGRLEPREVTGLGIAICDALEEVHEAGIVHRGIGAECIILDEEGGVRLTGFHFAKPGMEAGSRSPSSLVLRAPGGSAESPAHPAPEQFTMGEDDPRSDLFGLGWVLFESLTGEAPYADSNPVKWSTPRDARELEPATPLPLARALALCLAPSPSGRPADAAALRRALASVEVVAEATGAPTSPDPAREDAATAGRMRTERLWTLVACLAALAFALLIVDRSRGGSPAPGDQAADGSNARGAIARQRARPVAGSLVPRYERSYALLIGIGDAYDDNGFPALPNAEADVVAVSQALEQETGSPWEVSLLLGENATREAVVDALPLLADRVGPNDRVLVFFAGHGKAHHRDESGAWLVPSDGHKRKPSSWVRFDEILHLFKEMQAKHILVALDCCYGGRITAARSAANEAYAKRYLTRRAHVLLTSGLPDEEVSDGVAGEHSPFARTFLEALAGTGPLTSSALANAIREAFERDGVPHTPMYGYPEGQPPGGEFVFFRGGG